MKKFLFSILCCALLVSCTTTEPVSLIAIPDKNSTSYVQGNSILSIQADNKVQMIASADSYTGAKASFNVSIKSKTEDGKFNFTDSNISIYGGNKDKKKWKLVDTWDSQQYVRTVTAEANAAVVTAGIIGTLSVLDAIFNDNSSSTFIYDYGYDFYGGSSHFIYSSDDPLFATLSAIEATMVVSQLSDLYQAEEKSTILQCPTNIQVNSVSGQVKFNSLPKQPDYKLVFDNGKQKFEFIFSRADREEIINPLLDRSTPLIGLTYTYTLGLARHNVSMDYLDPNSFGGFFGLSYYEDAFNWGLNFGFNLKLADYTWFKAGFEICDITTEEETSDCLLSLGGLYSIGGLSLYGGGAYSFDENKFFAEFGGGFSF
ncbi:MAG: hypothetical protein HUK23_02530 [Sphaerochaetaceae bacterium]|nr:hypothetical protein [Sphaerochaetaceae bacterium]